MGISEPKCALPRPYACIISYVYNLFVITTLITPLYMGNRLHKVLQAQFIIPIDIATNVHAWHSTATPITRTNAPKTKCWVQHEEKRSDPSKKETWARDNTAGKSSTLRNPKYLLSTFRQRHNATLASSWWISYCDLRTYLQRNSYSHHEAKCVWMKSNVALYMKHLSEDRRGVVHKTMLYQQHDLAAARLRKTMYTTHPAHPNVALHVFGLLHNAFCNESAIINQMVLKFVFLSKFKDRVHQSITNSKSDCSHCTNANFNDFFNCASIP